MNLGFPDIAAFTLQVTFPCKGSYCAAYAVHAEVSCSIQLSYGAKSNLNRTPFCVCPANVLYFYFSRNLAIKKSKKSHLILWIKKCILEKLRNRADALTLRVFELSILRCPLDVLDGSTFFSCFILNHLRHLRDI